MDVEKLEVIDISEEEQNLNDNMKLLKNFRSQHIIDINMVRVFITIWIVATIFALLPMFRPSYSDVEKRDLKKFPKFTFTALASGDYFDEINLWFSDTFPMRDGFVSLNTQLTNTFGINTVQVHGDVVKGDEIPEVDEDSKKDTKKDSAKDSKKDSEKVESKPEQTQETPPPAVEQLGAMLIVDNAAYEYYNFSQATADNYIATLNRAAELLDGKAWVYDMIVPTSMAITLPDNFNGNTNSSDQKKAIDYMYSKMNKNVYSVDAYSTLLKHKDEYLYFRTDHHWTALGAYYSYRELMAVKGVKPVPLSTFKEHKFDGFLGSFYSQSGQKTCLGNNPDYVMAYEPLQTNTIQTITKNGTINYRIVSDGNALSSSNKYLSFICGDQPYGIINNPSITDGSACLIIKESYGNAMVAYLTQHFQNVYVVDYRYINQVFPGTIVQFVDERKIGDVFFVNNISATRSAGLVSAIAAFVG